MQDNLKPLPLTAKILGYGGLIPFVVLSLAVILNLQNVVPSAQSNEQSLLYYGAVITSFLGAVHWGIALADDGDRNFHFLYGVFPALLAWALMFFPEKPALIGMAVIVVLAYFVDRAILFKRLCYQYASLRMHLTIIVAVSLLAGGLAL